MSTRVLVARLIDLERARVEALAAELAPVLRREGTLAAQVDQLDDVERWRRAARRAGRLIGHHVRTGIAFDGAKVWAVSEDYRTPPWEAEQAGARRTALVADPRPPGGQRAAHRPVAERWSGPTSGW